MRALVCSAIEAVGVVLCIGLARSHHHWWGLGFAWSTIFFAYLDGKYGWSDMRE